MLWKGQHFVGTPTVSATGYWRQNWSNWYYHAVAMLLLPCCTVTLALQGKKNQENRSYASPRFCLSADKLMCEKKKLFTSFYFHLKSVSTTSAHEILFFQLVLSHNSWIWNYKALGNLQLQVPSQHRKFLWISASDCDTDTWFSFTTFPIHLYHCKYSNHMSSALLLSKCQWNMQTNPGTPSLPRLPKLALLFLLDFTKYPHNRGSDKTEMQGMARTSPYLLQVV